MAAPVLPEVLFNAKNNTLVYQHLRDSVTRFSTILLLKIFELGPIWTGENGFENLFVLAKIFDRKVRKSRVRVVNDYAETQIFYLHMDIFMF